jgi:hypothetical protein
LVLAPEKIECSKMDICGIAIRQGTLTSYDWSNCAYVNLINLES